MPEIQTPPVNPDAMAQADAANKQAEEAAQAQTGDTVQVRFMRPLSFGGIDYAVGVHDVPREHIEQDQWFFDEHAKEGNVLPGSDLAADGKPASVQRAPAAKNATRKR